MALELFTEEDLEAVRTMEAALGDLDELLTRSAQAGFDLGDLSERKAAIEAKLRGFKQAFFPGK